MVEMLLGQLPRLGAAALCDHARRQRDVLERREMGKGVVLLENEAERPTQLVDVGFRVVDRYSVHDDLAALDGLQAVDALQQGRLA